MGRTIKVTILDTGQLNIVPQQAFSGENNAVRLDCYCSDALKDYTKYIDFESNGLKYRSPAFTDNAANFVFNVPNIISNYNTLFQFVFIEGDQIIKTQKGTIYVQESVNAVDQITFESGDILNDFEQRITIVEGKVDDFLTDFTISVGTVTTLEAGQPATVEKTGTNINPVFNFGIPQGYPMAVQPLKHEFVSERYARTANRTLDFTGTIRTVGSGKTYSTISAAYAAAADLDQIHVYPGTYLTTNESGGYLLFNTSTKRVLIKGINTVANDVIISQNAIATYGIRFRDSSETHFENIYFKTDQNNAMILADNGYNNRLYVFNNCKFESTNTGSLACFGSFNDGLNTNTGWIEFKDCNFIKLVGGLFPFHFVGLGENYNILFDNCIAENAGSAFFVVNSGNKCKVSIYDTSIICKSNDVIIRVGEDTAIPSNNLGYVDIRNCNLSYSYLNKNHALLLGRGTVAGYVCNNIINTPPVNTSLNLGIVVKVIATNANNFIIEGNYVDSARPLYLKGCKKTVIKYNSFICNETNWESLGFANYYDKTLGNIASLENVIKYNNFVGGRYGVTVYTQDAEGYTNISAIKTNIINNNKYYLELNQYLFDGVTIFTFANKSSFWDINTNDNVSIELTLLQLPITY